MNTNRRSKVQYIGRVHSAIKTFEDCPLQESEEAPPATIEVYEKFANALSGIRIGSKLVLFTWLDKADRKVLSTHPRNDPKAPLTGVFLTRSPDRPNPIGMHRVTVTSIKNNTFEISALDVLDQTPVIDIKVDLNK